MSAIFSIHIVRLKPFNQMAGIASVISFRLMGIKNINDIFHSLVKIKKPFSSAEGFPLVAGVPIIIGIEPTPFPLGKGMSPTSYIGIDDLVFLLRPTTGFIILFL